MNRRYYFVTGGNSGIGFGTVQRILEEIDDSFVYLGSRSVERAMNAVMELDHELRSRVEIIQINLADENSIVNAKNTINEHLQRELDGNMLTAVVNNAGVMSATDMKLCVDINVVGTKKVSEIFLPLIVPGGKLLFVSSSAGQNFLSVCGPKGRDLLLSTKTDWSTVEETMNKVIAEFDPKKKSYSKTLGALGIPSFLQYMTAFIAPYTFSKACLNFYVKSLAEKDETVKENNIRVAALHPGAVETKMVGQMRDLKFKVPQEVCDEKKGAECTMQLLKKDNKEIVHGGFYNPDATLGNFVAYPRGVTGVALKFLYSMRYAFGL